MSIKTLNDQFVIETYYSIDYGKLEGLIDETFGFESGDICIPYMMDCGNDTNLIFTVKSIKQDEDDLDINRCTLDSLLDEMCYRGLIVPGEYLVKVSW